MPATQRARRMGYLVQGAMAYWPFSVEKVIELGRIPYQKWWQQPSVEDLQKVEAAMTKTESYRHYLVRGRANPGHAGANFCDRARTDIC